MNLTDEIVSSKQILLFLSQPRYLKQWKPPRSKLCCAIPCTTSFPRVEIRLLAASSAICRRTRTVTLLSAISWRGRLIAAMRNTTVIATRLFNEFKLCHGLSIKTRRNNGAFTVSGSEADVAIVAIDKFDHPFNLMLLTSTCRSLERGLFARDFKVKTVIRHKRRQYICDEQSDFFFYATKVTYTIYSIFILHIHCKGYKNSRCNI